MCPGVCQKQSYGYQQSALCDIITHPSTSVTTPRPASAHQTTRCALSMTTMHAHAVSQRGQDGGKRVHWPHVTDEGDEGDVADFDQEAEEGGDGRDRDRVRHVARNDRKPLRVCRQRTIAMCGVRRVCVCAHKGVRHDCCTTQVKDAGRCTASSKQRAAPRHPCSMQHKAAQQVYPTLHAEFRKFMPQIPIST